MANPQDIISPDLLAAHPEWFSADTGGGAPMPSLPGYGDPNQNYSGFGYGAPNPAAGPAAVPVNPNMQQAASNQYAPNGPIAGQYGAQQGLINASRDRLGAENAVLNATPEYIASQRNVQSAKYADAQANREYIAEQIRANEARLAEEAGIQAAKGNVQDITNVNRAQRERDNYAYRFELAGLKTPIEVKLPPGYKGKLPPGMVAKLESLADIMTEKAGDAEAMRRLTLEAARIKTATTGIAVTEAQLRSGDVALDIDELELAVKRAGLNQDAARLANDIAKMPPAPGMVFDEEANEWVQPGELASRQERRKIEEQGDYGLWSVAGLQDMLVRDASFEAEFRSIMQGRGYSPTTIERAIKDVNLRRKAADSGFDPSQFSEDGSTPTGGGGRVIPATAAPPSAVPDSGPAPINPPVATGIVPGDQAFPMP